MLGVTAMRTGLGERGALRPQTKIVVLLVLVAMVASGCGYLARARIRDDMEASKASYKACLDQNPNAPRNCEAARLAYEADLKAYQAFTPAVQ